eukprot:CAMPEP_0176121934 /NCGR_PEP_ID=MMETSP0120_2-20121206/61393_1 /TAXON_ID=160619 /ORGANISM="Kryptoperidinium foliaceum, Strain CCMP 1326" /LENGTH=95 /DNA_ID=CAMNT_0017456519 /DNA_START=685 /DNA_END=968 /DNA_ORIENTATION=+
MEGWLGKSKGLLQLCRERGLIDPAKHNEYRKTGSKLQVLGEAVGVSVDFTPKFHAELAGEGIEYSWGFSKGLYRRQPLERKKKRAQFRKLVDECA